MLRDRRSILLTCAGLLLACLAAMLGGLPAADGKTGAGAIAGLEPAMPETSGPAGMPSESAGLPSSSVADLLPTPAESEPAGPQDGHALACGGLPPYEHARRASGGPRRHRYPHPGRGPPAA